MGIVNRGNTLLGPNKSGNLFHGARAIERHHSCDIAKVSGLEFLDIAAHPGAFQLEDAFSFPRGQQLKSPGIIERNMQQIQGDSTILGNNFFNFSQNGQIR